MSSVAIAADIDRGTRRGQPADQPGREPVRQLERRRRRPVVDQHARARLDQPDREPEPAAASAAQLPLVADRAADCAADRADRSSPGVVFWCAVLRIGLSDGDVWPCRLELPRKAFAQGPRSHVGRGMCSLDLFAISAILAIAYAHLT